MRFILPFLLFGFIIPAELDKNSSQTIYVAVYDDLLEYQKSGKHFELMLINQQIFYVSEIIQLDSFNITINVLNDRRLGLNRNFQSLIEMEIENKYPKLLREIKIENIYMLNEIKRSSLFDKMPYSPTTLIVIIPLVLLFIKFISTMMFV